MKLKNECCMGNPVPGEVNGEVGSGDSWTNTIINNKNKKTKMKSTKKNNKISESVKNDIVDKFETLVDNVSTHQMFAMLSNYLNEDQANEFYSSIIKDYEFYDDEEDYIDIIDFSDSAKKLDRIINYGWSTFSILNEYVQYASIDQLEDFVNYVCKELDIDDCESLFESEEVNNFEYNNYDSAMIDELKSDGYIPYSYDNDDIEEFIDDHCMVFFANDEEELAKQYIEQMVGYNEVDTLSQFIESCDCLDYDAIGYELKITLGDSKEDEELLEMSDHELGIWAIDNMYSGNIEEFVRGNIKRIHMSSYINYSIAGESLINQYDYVKGVNNKHEDYYILIFY